jgi:hypothetical protein
LKWEGVPGEGELRGGDGNKMEGGGRDFKCGGSRRAEEKRRNFFHHRGTETQREDRRKGCRDECGLFRAEWDADVGAEAGFQIRADLTPAVEMAATSEGGEERERGKEPEEDDAGKGHRVEVRQRREELGSVGVRGERPTDVADVAPIESLPALLNKHRLRRWRGRGS